MKRFRLLLPTVLLLYAAISAVVRVSNGDGLLPWHWFMLIVFTLWTATAWSETLRTRQRS